MRRTRLRWVDAIGQGPWASVSLCEPDPISLHRFKTEAEAIKARDRIDRIGCSGRCGRRHEVLNLEDISLRQIAARP